MFENLMKYPLLWNNRYVVLGGQLKRGQAHLPEPITDMVRVIRWSKLFEVVVRPIVILGVAGVLVNCAILYYVNFVVGPDKIDLERFDWIMEPSMYLFLVAACLVVVGLLTGPPFGKEYAGSEEWLNQARDMLDDNTLEYVATNLNAAQQRTLAKMVVRLRAGLVVSAQEMFQPLDKIRVETENNFKAAYDWHLKAGFIEDDGYDKYFALFQKK